MGFTHELASSPSINNSLLNGLFRRNLRDIFLGYVWSLGLVNKAKKREKNYKILNTYFCLNELKSIIK